MLYNLYYSPTGGTKKAAIAFAEGFNYDRKDINFFSKSETLESLELKKEDLLIVSCPCYGGVAPFPAINKLHNIKGNDTLAIVVAVYGNRATDDELLQLQDTLKERGFRVIAGVEALAEHSLARNVAKGRPNNNDKDVLKGFAKEITKLIDTKTWNKDLVLPGNRPYKEFHGSGTKPICSPDNKCIQCHSCYSNCPVDAISEDKPWEQDNDKCISCMHCVSICPTGARIIDPIKSKGTEEKLMSMCPEAKENKLFV